MPGPKPKPKELRQRRNKKADAAELTAPINAKIPKMPNPDKRKFHRLARDWWKHVWQSPMSQRYLMTDFDGLGMLLLLVDSFYKGAIELAGEIRLQSERFGLSNLARTKMDWSIAGAVDRPIQRASPNRAGQADPRKFLKAVK